MKTKIFQSIDKPSELFKNSAQETKSTNKTMSNKTIINYDKELSYYQLPLTEVNHDETIMQATYY